MRIVWILVFAATISLAAWAGASTLKDVPGAGVRIIGGAVAIKGEYPYIVAVYVTQTSGTVIFCAGTIISPLWILTAGHCVQDNQSILVQIGTNSLNENSIYVQAVYPVIHPEFNATSLAHDIALLRLKIPIGYNDHIKAAALPLGDTLPKTSLTTAGWGQTDESPGIVNDLHFAQVTMLDDRECKSYYGDAIVANMVCVNGDYFEGTCRGDSGAPLILMNNDFPTRDTVIGVSCFISQNGCLNADPSGFTKVYPYLEWIRNVTLLIIG